jgi:hypothetical protein
MQKSSGIERPKGELVLSFHVIWLPLSSHVMAKQTNAFLLQLIPKTACFMKQL